MKKAHTAASAQDILADLLSATPDPVKVILSTRQVVDVIADGIVAMLERGFSIAEVRERLATHGVVIGERSLRAYMRDAGITRKGHRGPKRPARTARKKTTSSGRDRGAPAASGASAAGGAQAPPGPPAGSESASRAPPDLPDEDDGDDEFARADQFRIG